MHKTKTPRPKGHTTSQPQPLEMRVVVTNGLAAKDANLKFQFLPDHSGTARVWVVKLPALRNPDAFPHQLAPDVWELRLEAVAATQPLQILNYTSESARRWLADVANQPKPAPTELLILARDGHFTVSLHQSPN